MCLYSSNTLLNYWQTFVYRFLHNYTADLLYYTHHLCTESLTVIFVLFHVYSVYLLQYFVCSFSFVTHRCGVCRCGRQENGRRPEHLTCTRTSTSWGRTLTWSQCRCAAGRLLHFPCPVPCFLIPAPSDCSLLRLRLIESMIPGRMISFPQVIPHTLKIIDTPNIWALGLEPVGLDHSAVGTSDGLCLAVHLSFLI